MRDFIAVTKALSDPNRVRVLMFLQGGELCLCQIIEMLALAPSTVSKHMAVLHNARLIESRKEGRWVYFALSESQAPSIRGAIAWAKDALRTDKQTIADAKVVKSVRKLNPKKLCTTYKRT
ncbi:MAG: winged helix-turn-helix transcriptional regulator [bacterium]|nr:winged helix-turn-helix transcriptional regulator [bacterium]